MTRGIDQQSDDFYDSVRKVLQETHDSTVRTEMICQSLADKIQMHDALAQQHASKISRLETALAVSEDRVDQRRSRINWLIALLSIPGIGYIAEKIFSLANHGK